MSDTLSVSNALSRNSLLEQIAHPTLVNPLAAQTSAATAAEQVWRVRQQQANQASGEAYQGAIDAQGNFDPVKYRQNLAAAGPGAALAAGAGVTSAQELQGQQIDQASKVRAQIASMLAPLADPNLTPEQRHAGMVNVANQALDAQMPRQQVLSTLLHVPTDPAGQLAAIEQIRRSLLPPSELQTVTHGQIGTEMGPGGVRVPTVQNRQTGAYTQAPGGVQTGLSPGEASARTVVGYDKQTGQPIYGPAEQVAPPRYGGTGGPAPVGPGRLPPALQGPGGGQGGAPPPPAAGANSTNVAAPDTRVAEQNKADQEAFLADQKGIPTRQTGVQSLINAQHALELTRTGANTQSIHNLKSFLAAQGVISGDADESVTNYDKFKKAALDYARQQASGAGTNLQLEAAEHSNANPDMVNAANRSVIQTNIGRERQAIAATLASPDQKLGSGHIAHKSQFANDTDPRGFAVDRYTPEELTKLTNSMTDTEKTKFYKSVGIARRLHLLNPQ